jgi:shikimate kinase
MKIFLIGMMGSGKSYWAEKLKKKFKIPAYDLDGLVEMMEEKTISEMFAEDGEEFFRKAEAKMLRMFKEKKQFILSCGGGTPCFADNMNWMNKNGITIWLDEPVEVLAERLSAEKGNRPLIKDLEDDELKIFLSAKIAEREFFYNMALHRLSGNNLNETAFAQIIKQHA